jgi:hypothetical protein
MDDYEVFAQELSDLREKWRAIEERLAEVERVNARLEEAALTTARALGEVSRHWDAVYDAMRRAHKLTTRSRPSATTMRLGRVAATHPIRVWRHKKSPTAGSPPASEAHSKGAAIATEAPSLDEWVDEGGASH